MTSRIWWVALAAGMCVSGAHAQTLDGKAGSGKLMTINELRACIKQQDQLKVDKAELDQRRKALDAQRADIMKEGEAIKPLDEAVQQRAAKISEFNVKVKAFAERAKAFQERRANWSDEGRSGPNVDRQRRELEREQKALETEDAANVAEGKALTEGVEKMVNDLNQRAQANQAQAVAWNQQNKALETESRGYEDRRMDWSTNCGGRRYREDDEKALRAEKK